MNTSTGSHPHVSQPIPEEGLPVATVSGEVTLDIGRGERLLLPPRKTLIGGLAVEHLFSDKTTHPYDMCDWVKRTVSIFDYAKGKPSFSRDNVEVPAFWSENSVRITSAKYLFGSTPGTAEYEDSLRHPFDRIANTYTIWGWKNGYFSTLDDARTYNWELKAMLLNQIWAPNSPVWFNIGHWEQYRWGRPDLRADYSKKGNKAFKTIIENGKLTTVEIGNSLSNPQTSACFITEIEDSMESILKHGISEGRIFSSGSGVGLNISTLRSSHEPIAGRGRSSGPLSFNKGWDRMAGAIKSGGRSRRAARMVLLDSDHPDIFDFVRLKNSQEQIAKIILREHNSHEELKRIAGEKLQSGNDAERVAAGFLLALPLVNTKTYDGGMDGEIYGETISDQNANHSVSLRGDYWKSYWADGSYSTRWVTKKDKIHETFKARKLLEEMSSAVYDNAEPGCHNNDYINLWNPVKSNGRISTSNPCVTGDSLVAGQGLTAIERLVDKTPSVAGRDGQLTPASAVFATGTKPVYRLRTESGFSLKLTADHRVDTAARGDVTAMNLTKDDRVRLRGAAFGNHSVSPQVARLAASALSFAVLKDVDGVKTAIWTLPEGEAACAGHICDLINTLKPHGEVPVHIAVVKSIPDAVTVSTSRPDVLRTIEILCEIGEAEETKALTPKALQLNQDSLCILIQAFGDCCGSVVKTVHCPTHVAFRSKSERLLMQLQLLLLSFGIKAKLGINRLAAKDEQIRIHSEEMGHNLVPVSQSHHLSVTRADRVVYEKLIGFHKEAKRIALEESNRDAEPYVADMTDQVESLEYVGDLPVYDITEPRTNHFVANGIVVHNCSEFLHLNNTSCNLSSFNAYRFLKDGVLQVAPLKHAVRLAMIAADLNIEESGFPIKEIAEGTYKYRTTGIGFGNVGGLLMSLGVPYDSDEGRYLSGLLLSAMTASCWIASAEMGRELGGYFEHDKTHGDLEEVLNLHRACHQLLMEMPGISDGSKDPDEVLSRITEGGGRLPQADGLTGGDALKALKNSFELKTPWDPARIKSSGLLVEENLWGEIDTRAVFRNSFVSLIQPGGTVSAPLGVYDQGTTAAEPDYSLVKYKTLSGGGSMTMFNSLALEALRILGYSEFQIKEAALEVAGLNGLIVACGGLIDRTVRHLESHPPKEDRGPVRNAYANTPRPAAETLADLVSGLSQGKNMELPPLVANGSGNVENIPWLPTHHKEVFDCASTIGGGVRAIAPAGHIRMLGALMPFVSGAISKTINLPHYATKDDILKCFEMSHQMGVKCIALYRADSKGVSVYQTDSPEAKKWDAHHIWKTLVSTVEGNVADVRKEASKPRRRKLPGSRTGQIVKFDLSGKIDGFIVAGVYPDGRCGEVFGRLGQGGSFAHGMFESFCKAFSVMLQWGVPLPDAIRAFKNTAFDPAGFVKVAEGNCDVDVKSCKSVVDLMMRMLEWLFPESNGYRLRDYGNELPPVEGVSLEPAPPLPEEWDEPSTPRPVKDELSSAEMCPECHALAVIQDGRCRRCSACGFSNGGCGA